MKKEGKIPKEYTYAKMSVEHSQMEYAKVINELTARKTQKDEADAKAPMGPFEF